METNSNRLCDEEGVKRAIDLYDKVDNFGEIELMTIPISQLESEIGKDAFNSELLNIIWAYLELTRCGDNVCLGPIIFNSLKKGQYRSAERDSNLTPVNRHYRSGLYQS